MIKSGKEDQRMKLFESVCMACSRDLQKFIYTLTRKDQFAMEEIYQNTMLGALKGLENLRDNRKMKDWLFVIAKEESKRYYAAKKSIMVSEYGLLSEDARDSSDDRIDFTKSIEDKEAVKQLINSLSEDEQQLYILHYYYDLPLREISEILNLNYSTIRSKHIRGMGKLRKLLMDGEAV